MATIELQPSLYGYVFPNSGVTVSQNNKTIIGMDAVGDFFIKFDVAPLSSYRKKVVTETYLKCINNGAVPYMGGAFSWVDPFTGDTTYETQPKSGIIFFKYLDISGNNVSGTFTFPYYDAGKIGYDGQPTPRDLFSQISIGFKINNQVKAEDKKSLQWGFFNVGQNPPVFGFSFSDWNPILTARFPAVNAFVNYAVANTFSAGFDAFDSIDYPTVTTVTYEVKDLATSVVTSHDVTMSVNLKGRTYVDIPVAANTFAVGKDYQWRVKLVTDDGTTNFSEWANFTTKDSVPGSPTIISPQSKYIDGASAITLTWQHNVNTGSVQHAFDLDYKQSGDWVSLAAHTISSAQSFTVPANTFAAGTMYWRVRTYNTDNVVGDYGTSAANVVQAKPVTPIIQSITTAPRTTVNWQSTGQQSYQLSAKDSTGKTVFDTGETYGTAKSMRIDDYLPNGNYTFDLTIQNGQGTWSDHATTTVTIKNTPPSGDDILSAEPISGGVRLNLSVPESGSYAQGTAYLLRDGQPIAKITDYTYVDYTSSGECQYVCRIVTDDGNYFETNTVTAAPVINYACIAKLSLPQNILTLKFNEGSKPKLENQLSKVISEHYFAGRALAVQDVTEHHNSTWNYNYSFIDKANYKILEQLLLDGETVMFRDFRGYKAVGTLKDLHPTISGKTITVSFSISETDAIEVIDYE